MRANLHLTCTPWRWLQFSTGDMHYRGSVSLPLVFPFLFLDALASLDFKLSLAQSVMFFRFPVNLVTQVI